MRLNPSLAMSDRLAWSDFPGGRTSTAWIGTVHFALISFQAVLFALAPQSCQVDAQNPGRFLKG